MRITVSLRNKSIVLFIMILLVFTTLPAFAAILNDIEGHWAEASIEKMVEQGIIKGYDDGSFKPDNEIKRIEFIALMIRASNIEIGTENTDQYWGAPYVKAALDAGYLDADTFGSSAFEVYEAEITREEMAYIVVRAYMVHDYTIDSDLFIKASDHLTDYNTASSQFLDSTISSVALGLITGYPEGVFKPLGKATRAEATIVLERWLNLMENPEPTGQVDASHTYSESHPFSTLSSTFSIADIEIGDAASLVTEIYGVPVRKDLSPYGFQWWVYHTDYFDYFMVGVNSNGIVVALYTASDQLDSSVSIDMYDSKMQLTAALGNPIDVITKGKDQYLQINDAESAVFLKDNVYLTAYFDLSPTGNATMFSTFIIDAATEKNTNSLYGSLNDSVRVAYEKQVFDLNNVYRVANGKTLLTWNETIASTARKHSEDMAKRAFFDHTNPSNFSPFDRIASDGIDFTIAAENIAAGYLNPFAAHAGWVNSPGHRENLLRNIENLGVGVYFGGPYEIYYTQNYFSK
ncbi:CAP-associated domain-containing protein [Fusibacter tunisiensis]|uniref:Uncharacterized protein YkwD n=1 Tax=Fusibacter tunisiensis TaxID=1008308 RepID=A0ABS2MPD4_9FIRM|nr:CAP-associated domain-containing protein [Fusibacter tunisiensis]MBM7561261.1 uncharacterized protein YkwD [Fusibacter tunisiensis]